MSDIPKKRVPTRRAVPPGGARGDSPPPRSAAPPPRVAGTPTRPVGSVQRRTAPPGPNRYTNVNAAPKRDAFPYVMGGIIGALVVGLIVVVIILSAGNGNNNSPVAAGNPTNAAINPAPQGTVVAQAQPTSEYEPVRMDLATFKSLYDDPAKRPVIIDVRRQDIFDSGHIAGAIDVPFEEMDANLSKIPKDKMVVLYCQ